MGIKETLFDYINPDIEFEIINEEDRKSVV